MYNVILSFGQVINDKFLIIAATQYPFLKLLNLKCRKKIQRLFFLKEALILTQLNEPENIDLNKSNTKQKDKTINTSFFT